MKKMYFKVIFLFMCNACLANMMDVDQKCSNGQQITVIWWSQEPYVYTSEDHANEDGHQDEQAKQEFLGMFPVILNNIFKHCCNGTTNLNYTKTPDGPASLDSLLAKQQFDLIIPVGAQAGALTVRRFPFAGILESPGVAVLIRGNVSGTQLLLSVLQGWPILVFILISASLAGVVIWLVERKKNADQFPVSFSHGVFEGFWWAFITMTTVGYGDKAPRTTPGKLVGILWMLAGLIITTMFISIITSSLTSVSLAGRTNLRGVTVSAVNHSEEHKLGIRETAEVEALSSSEDVFQFVIDRRVDGALVDVHGLKHHIKSLSQHNIQVGNILSNHVSYGAVFALNSSRLLKCFRGYLQTEEQWLFHILAENTGTTQTKISVAEDYFGSGGIFSITVYSGLSMFVVLIAVGLGWEMYKKHKKNTKQQNGQTEVVSETGTIILENLDSQPTPRLSFGQDPSEQLVSKQSMEIMKMDEELNSFQQSWQERHAVMLQRHQQERAQGPSSRKASDQP